MAGLLELQAGWRSLARGAHCELIGDAQNDAGGVRPVGDEIRIVGRDIELAVGTTAE